MKALPSIAFDAFSGTAGDVTARISKGRQVLSVRATQPHVCTPAQAAARNRLADISRAYPRLTQDQMKAWEELAAHLDFPAVLGQKAEYSGINAFVCVNSNLRMAGLPLRSDYTVEALRMAIRNAGCRLDGLIHHSDRGCQYCCEKYVKLLQDNGILISMTECGNPRENAIAERVNGILKSEWLNDEHFYGISDARIRIAEVIYIYNNKRPHLSLDYATPAQACLMVGEQTRKWKNYYKTKESPEKAEEIILSLTSDVRTNLQTSGL